MGKRRSLDDALTPEEEAFLKLTSTPKQQLITPKSKPKKKKESPPMPTHAVKEQFTPDESVASNNPPQYSIVGTGSINARIDPTIATALLRASVERRIKRQAPSTQRDIIAEALSDWLKRHGHLS